MFELEDGEVGRNNDSGLKRVYLHSGRSGKEEFLCLKRMTGVD